LKTGGDTEPEESVLHCASWELESGASVRRLMKEQGLKAMQPCHFKPLTTDSRGVRAAPNLLAGVKLEECAAGQIIVGDITYISLRDGKWCYLAIWQDKVTRRIVGWSLAGQMTAELVI